MTFLLDVNVLIALIDSAHISHDPRRILASGQVTDSYLLALAVSHRGHLATFDRRLSPAAVRGGKAALHLFDSR